MLGVLTCHGGSACSIVSTLSALVVGIIVVVVIAGILWNAVRSVGGRTRRD
jgi:hypothetical protein